MLLKSNVIGQCKSIFLIGDFVIKNPKVWGSIFH